MRIRRHLPPISSLGDLAGGVDRRRAIRWGLIGLATLLAGYLTAYLVLFPAPILPGHHSVPRVLGLSLTEAQGEVQKAELEAAEGGAEPHPFAAQGTVIWQDPPPGVLAPEGTKVTLVASAGPPKIAVPDVSGLDAGLARTLVGAAGLQLGTMARRTTPDATPGTVIAQRPGAGTLAAPGTVVDIIVARSP